MCMYMTRLISRKVCCVNLIAHIPFVQAALTFVDNFTFNCSYQVAEFMSNLDHEICDCSFSPSAQMKHCEIVLPSAQFMQLKS